MADRASSQGSFTPAILKRFDQPDEVRLFKKGRFEIVHIGGMAIGRATYEPGWRWSEHVGAKIGQRCCAVEHLGYVVSGAATAAFDDGRVFELRAGEMFYISPEPHDSWVLGNEPYATCTATPRLPGRSFWQFRYEMNANGVGRCHPCRWRWLDQRTDCCGW